MRWLIGFAVALATLWLVLIIFLAVTRPRGMLGQESLRILPDTLGLLRRLARDRAVPRSVRLRLWLLFVYLAIPIDVVPDFLPVVGYADDVVIVVAVLRSVVRRVGYEAVLRNWRGTEEGIATLTRVAGVLPE